jgi:hypothetical protein
MNAVRAAGRAAPQAPSLIRRYREIAAVLIAHGLANVVDALHLGRYDHRRCSASASRSASCGPAVCNSDQDASCIGSKKSYRARTAWTRPVRGSTAAPARASLSSCRIVRGSG